MDSHQEQREAHLQQWFAQSIPTPSPLTRLEVLNLTQIAHLSDLSEGEVREFTLGQQRLSPEQLAKLVTVLEALGYTSPNF